MALSHAFFDTSVLVGGMIDFGGGASEAPQRLIDAVADGRIERPLTAWHCCLEFYSVTTRLPHEYRLAPPLALRFLSEEILPRFQVESLPVEARQGFLDAALADRVIGGRIYDSHIAETARCAGAEFVITDNRRHFTSLLRHGIRVLLSDEAAQML